MKKYLILNRWKLSIVAICTLIIVIVLSNKAWIVNLVWMNAAAIGHTFHQQGPHTSIAIFIVIFCICIIWDLFWKIYSIIVRIKPFIH